jgi:serine/threonine protein kinase
MPDLAASALLQAALRRRLLTRDEALELGKTLHGTGLKVEPVRERLKTSNIPQALVLLELLPSDELPQIANYRRLARLGEGRTSSTWLGLGKSGLVVIKVFHASRLPPGKAVDKFLADVSRLIGGHHHYLVNYLASGKTADGRACLIEEYHLGRDLTSRATTKGAMREGQALTLMRHAAKGLRALEFIGCCHGLLHPGNILLDASGRARLNDYGFVFCPEDKGPRIGWDARSLMLHAWSAPETLAEKPAVNLLSDCYSLACIGYWMLANQPPFTGTPEQQARQHLQASRPDVRTKLPPVTTTTAKTLIQAMQLAPANRFEHPQLLVAALQYSLDELLKQTQLGDELDTTDMTPTSSAALAEHPPGKKKAAAAKAGGPEPGPDPSGVRPAISSGSESKVLRAVPKNRRRRRRR